MKTKDVVFERQQGGLARTAPGEDHVSAFISYGGPGSVSSLQHLEGVADNTKLITTIFSLKQAEALGIIPNSHVFNEFVINEVIGVEDNPDTTGVDETVQAVLPADPKGVHNIWHYHISELTLLDNYGLVFLKFQIQIQMEQELILQMEH